MAYSPLAAVKHRIKLGAPVPFSIRNADETLLLARGQLIVSEEQLEALFERGALVDAEELKTHRQEVAEALPEHLPGLWAKYCDRLARTLRSAADGGGAQLAEALDEAAQPVLTLVERDPDLAIFQLVRQEGRYSRSYGVSHSVHAAVAGFLVGQRLGWAPAKMATLFKAGLTMNLAVLELQTRLATQSTPLTPEQREAIHAHPARSVEMLRTAGIVDEEWLAAVSQHHETPEGTGYPDRLTQVCDTALLLRWADIYTAKLSGRATRDALPPHRAGREVFVQDHGQAMAAALIKEFGVYPPGCFVTLASGEVGVVIRRGPSATQPIVAALTNRRGEPLIDPVRRHTAHKDHAITAVVSEATLRVRISPERLSVLAHT